jgi:hypothetical protein
VRYATYYFVEDIMTECRRVGRLPHKNGGAIAGIVTGGSVHRDASGIGNRLANDITHQPNYREDETTLCNFVVALENPWVIGIVTGLISGWLFYILAGRDLRQEAERLRKQTDLLMRTMEEPGFSGFSRDKNNQAKGLIKTPNAGSQVDFGTSADVDHTREVAGDAENRK